MLGLEDLFNESQAALAEEATTAVEPVNDFDIAGYDDGVIEINDDAVRVEYYESAADSLVEVSQGLESLITQAEDSLKLQGLDPLAATVISTTYDELINRVEDEDLAIVGIPVASVEAYGGTNTRIGATTVSVESMKATLKEAGNKLLAALKKMWEFATTMVGKIFSSISALKSRAKKVNAEAFKRKAGSGDVKIANATALSYKGAVGFADIKKGIKATETAVDDWCIRLPAEIEKELQRAFLKEWEKPSFLKSVDISGGYHADADELALKKVSPGELNTEMKLPSPSDIGNLAHEVVSLLETIEKAKAVVWNVQKIESLSDKIGRKNPALVRKLAQPLSPAIIRAAFNAAYATIGLLESCLKKLPAK